MSTDESKQCPKCGGQNRPELVNKNKKRPQSGSAHPELYGLRALPPRSEAGNGGYTEAIAHESWCPEHPLNLALGAIAGYLDAIALYLSPQYRAH